MLVNDNGYECKLSYKYDWLYFNTFVLRFCKENWSHSNHFFFKQKHWLIVKKNTFILFNPLLKKVAPCILVLLFSNINNVLNTEVINIYYLSITFLKFLLYIKTEHVICISAVYYKSKAKSHTDSRPVLDSRKRKSCPNWLSWVLKYTHVVCYSVALFDSCLESKFLFLLFKKSIVCPYLQLRSYYLYVFLVLVAFLDYSKKMCQLICFKER